MSTMKLLLGLVIFLTMIYIGIADSSSYENDAIYINRESAGDDSYEDLGSYTPESYESSEDSRVKTPEPIEDYSRAMTIPATEDTEYVVVEETTINEVDIPGEDILGEFYDKEYHDYMEENKNNALDGAFSSWRTMSLFILLVFIATSVYVVYNYRHRIFRARRSNYNYSRLGETYDKQPLI